MKKSNVLIIPADFYPNNTGFSNATLNLINSLSEHKKDIQVHVFTTVPLKDKLEISSAKVIRYKETSYNRGVFVLLSNYKKYKYIRKYVIDNYIEFILLETNTFSVLQSLLCNEFKDILAVRIHSTADTEVMMYSRRKKLTHKLLRKLDLDFMKEVKYIISTNNYHLDFIKRVMFKENVYTIWSDKEYFILPNTIFLKNSNIMSLNSNEDYVLTLGKLSANGYVQKGLQDLLKAIYILKKNNIIPTDFKLKLVGDGEKRDELLQYSRRLGVDIYIDFIKKTDHDETLGLIKNAKAIILLSRYEGQSIFITETLALGKSIVITANNGMKDMIINGNNGIVVNEGDYIEASNAIKKLYEMNDSEIDQMGNESRRIFLEKFSPQKVSEVFSEILEMVNPKN